MRGNGVDNLPPCFDFACPWSDPIMNRLSQFCALAVTLAVLSGCGTLSDMVMSNLPETHSGWPSIVVSLREQEAYHSRERERSARSRISSARARYRRLMSAFEVMRKDAYHRSDSYCD